MAPENDTLAQTEKHRRLREPLELYARARMVRHRPVGADEPIAKEGACLPNALRPRLTI